MQKYIQSIVMDPQSQFCPNLQCAMRGVVGGEHLRIHSRKDNRYRCRSCGRTFSGRSNTAFYRLRYPEAQVEQVITLLGYGCPLVAIVMAFGLDERTVLGWSKRAAKASMGVQQHYVQRLRAIHEVQCDEMRVRIQAGIVWMALAMESKTRLWLAGAVSFQRDLSLLKQLLSQVKACVSALSLGVLIVSDGLNLYPRAVRQTFRDPVFTGKRGRPRWQAWPHICIAQVVKVYQGRTLVGVERRRVQGSPAQVEALRHKAQGAGVLNTAFIERLNGTFRSRIAPLTRRTHALVRSPQRLNDAMWLVGTLYNFCDDHHSLRLPGVIGGHRWLSQTPAMAAGLTDHRWSVREVLCFRQPPPPLPPPQRSPGRPRKSQLPFQPLHG